MRTLEDVKLAIGDPTPERRGPDIARYTYRHGIAPQDGAPFRAPDAYRRIPEWCDAPVRIVWVGRDDCTILTYHAGAVAIEEYDTCSGYLYGVDQADRVYCPEDYRERA